MKSAITVISVIYCFTLLAANEMYKPRWGCEDDEFFIKFSNVDITNKDRNFINSPLLTCLDFRNSSMNMEEGIFDEVPNLTKLYFSYNNMYIDKLFSFGSYNKLKVLALEGAKINKRKENSKEIFSYYPELEFLSIEKSRSSESEGQYYYVDEYDFMDTFRSVSPRQMFPQLKLLDLSDNNIKNYNFSNLLPDSLQHLYLQDNKLRKLELRNLNELITLAVDNNIINYLGDYNGLVLKNLRNLRYLSISGNKILAIRGTTFQDVTDLIYLNLSKNGLGNSELEGVANLQTLKTLDLSHNLFSMVPQMMYLLDVEVFFLNCNQIKQITSDAFAKMPKLTELSLKGNQINTIYVDGFANLVNLVRLDLSSNNLASLPEGWSNSFINLKSLDLSNNQLISLKSLSLSKDLRLENLYLGNSLESFTVRSLEDLPQDVTVTVKLEISNDSSCLRSIQPHENPTNLDFYVKARK